VSNSFYILAYPYIITYAYAKFRENWRKNCQSSDTKKFDDTQADIQTEITHLY